MAGNHPANSVTSVSVTQFMDEHAGLVFVRNLLRLIDVPDKHLQARQGAVDDLLGVVVV